MCVCVSLYEYVLVCVCLCVSMLLCGGSYRDMNKTSETLELELQGDVDCPVWVIAIETSIYSKQLKSMEIIKWYLDAHKKSILLGNM